jgi:hypothetical protein
MPKKSKTSEGGLFPAGIPVERLIGLKKRVEDLAAARRTPEMEAEIRRFARDLEERVRHREEIKCFLAEAMRAI